MNTTYNRGGFVYFRNELALASFGHTPVCPYILYEGTPAPSLAKYVSVAKASSLRIVYLLSQVNIRNSPPRLSCCRPSLSNASSLLGTRVDTTRAKTNISKSVPPKKRQKVFRYPASPLMCSSANEQDKCKRRSK
jgi:hypothetical protein